MDMDNKKKRNSMDTVLIIIIGVLLFLILVTAALLFVRPIFRDKSNSNLIDKKLTVGKRYLSEMDYENAAASFSDVIRIDDKNIDAHVGLGDAYTGMGNWEEAVNSYDRAIDCVIEKVDIRDEIGEEHDRARVMANADLDDIEHEYMRDEELAVIAVIVENTEESESDDAVAVADLIGDHPSVKQVFEIIEKRNDAIDEVIIEREENGEDISEFQDYIDWTNAVEQGLIITDQQDRDPAAAGLDTEATAEPMQEAATAETGETAEASQDSGAEQDVDYESFYAVPLADYRELVGYSGSISDGMSLAENKKLSQLFVERLSNGPAYYKFMDINADGFDELLIATSYGDQIIINDVYTNAEGSPEHIIKTNEDDYYYRWLGDRYRLTLDPENHELMIYGSYSAFSSYIHSYNYGIGMIYPQSLGQYTYDTTMSPVYSFEDNAGTVTEISSSEFEEKQAKCDETLNNPEIFDASGWNTF